MLRTIVAAAVMVFGGWSADSAFGQGLIWSLPQDGTWVRYEGTVQQVQHRPDTDGGDLQIEWIRHIIIKSVGQEQAEFNGQTVPCRWIEIKSVTGKAGEAGVDAGPVGEVVYKALVPESAVIGQMRDADNVIVTELPVVKGFRKVGTRPVEPLEAKVLQVAPLLTYVRHYDNLDVTTGVDEELDLPLGSTPAQKLQTQLTRENQTDRSIHEATLWRSKDIPFGLARWSVKVIVEEKTIGGERSTFQPLSEVRSEMSAVQTGMAAESEINAGS